LISNYSPALSNEKGSLIMSKPEKAAHGGKELHRTSFLRFEK
jgi:hypothetical protein